MVCNLRRKESDAWKMSIKVELRKNRLFAVGTSVNNKVVIIVLGNKDFYRTTTDLTISNQLLAQIVILINFNIIDFHTIWAAEFSI